MILYDPFGGPYRRYDPTGSGERWEIRRTVGGVCWVVLSGVLLMSAVLPIVGKVYLQRFGFTFLEQNDFGGLPPVMYYLLLSVDYIVGLALPAFLYFYAKRIPLWQGLPFRRTGALDLFLYVAFGSMVCMLANYPANLVSEIQEAFGFSGELPSMPLTDDLPVLILYGVDVVLIPPLVEEILFRGMVLQSLRRYGDGFAVLFSAMLFGLYHGNFIQMAFAFFCGLALGFAVIRTDSLLPAILIHLINNGVSLAIELVSRYRGEQAALAADHAATICLIAAGALALALLFARRKLFSGRSGASMLPLSSRMGAAFSNGGALVFVLYSLVSSVYVLQNA